jgi:hypothetical protein
VAQVQEIGDIGVTAEEVDVTTLDAGDYRDFIQGFKDAGECEMTVIWDYNVVSHSDDPDGLIGLFDVGDVRDWAIKYNSGAVGGVAYGLFTGFIRDMTYGALNPDDAQTISPVIRITSPITIADVLPATQEALDAVYKKGRDIREKRRREAAARRAAQNPRPAPVPAGATPATPVQTL